MHRGCVFASNLHMGISKIIWKSIRSEHFGKLQFWEFFCQPFGENTFSKNAPKTKHEKLTKISSFLSNQTHLNPKPIFLALGGLRPPDLPNGGLEAAIKTAKLAALAANFTSFWEFFGQPFARITRLGHSKSNIMVRFSFFMHYSIMCSPRKAANIIFKKCQHQRNAWFPSLVQLPTGKVDAENNPDAFKHASDLFWRAPGPGNRV